MEFVWLYRSLVHFVSSFGVSFITKTKCRMLSLLPRLRLPLIEILLSQTHRSVVGLPILFGELGVLAELLKDGELVAPLGGANESVDDLVCIIVDLGLWVT